MRILFISHNYLPGHPSGTEIHTAQLARRLADRGHDVRVFTTEKDIARAHGSLERREWDGLLVHELTNNLFYEDFRETWDWPPARVALETVLDEFAPDVVHVMHLLYLSISCVEELAARGIPIFYTLHDFWLSCARFGQRLHADGSVCETVDFARCGTCLPSLKYAQTPFERKLARAIAGVRAGTGVDLGPAARGVAKRLGGRSSGGNSSAGAEAWTAPAPERARAMEQAARERDQAFRERLVPRVERFFAPSRFLRERMLAWGLPAERVEQTGYGIELGPFAGFERSPAEKVRVAFLGTLAPHKGPHLLLEAWEALAPNLREAASLTLYGPKQYNPDYVAELERSAARVGAQLAGGVRREGVARVLQYIDLLVVPSVWFENSPLSIHEALATRTALVVSDFGGMAELVEPGRHGWRFRMGDSEALRSVLADVLADPESLRRLDFGDEPVKDVTRTAAEMEARYREALGAEA